MRLNIHSITSQINEHNGEMNNMKILSGRFILIVKKMAEKAVAITISGFSKGAAHLQLSCGQSDVFS